VTNVKFFGAKGDGVTNDTTAIQNAVNFGGKIYFPKGIYLCSGITVPSNTTIVGAGIGVSILKLVDAPTTALIDINGTTGNVKENITIADITLMHNKTFVRSGYAGILISGEYTRRILLSRVECKTFNTYAVYVKETDDNATESQSWLINQCIFRDGGSSSVGVYFDIESEYSTLSNCLFHTVKVGVQLLDAANNAILNSTFLHCENAVWDFMSPSMANAGKLRILGCAMNHGTGIAIYIQHSTVPAGQLGVQISNNEILYGAFNGIFLRGARGSIVTNNRIWTQNPADAAILFQNLDTVIGDYNIISNNISIGGVLLANTATGTHNVIQNNIENVPSS
jgi:hypothetical protein